ncbi:MAG TPA: hypothetical protein ENK85_05270 [Saprospiraceae bacterium]|nr:hypothetical protein [Saprospiraceae bacterium]
MTLYDSILKEGEEVGVQKGIQKGMQKGMQKGKQNTLTIIQMLKDGIQPQEIANQLEEDIEYVLELKRQLEG